MRQLIAKYYSRVNPHHALLVVAATFAMYVFTNHVAYSLTPSLSHRFFATDSLRPHEIKGLKQGGYVTFDVEHPYEAGVYIREIKRIGCAAGQTLTVSDNWEYACDGQYLGRGKDRNKKGLPTKRFRYDGVIPAGMLFLVGDHADSYDSRYLGFIASTAVKEKMWPIF